MYEDVLYYFKIYISMLFQLKKTNDRTKKNKPNYSLEKWANNTNRRGNSKGS